MSQSEKKDWRDLAPKRPCSICTKYGDDTEHHKALVDYLDTPVEERRGVRWHTFVTLYLREVMKADGASSTWARHVDECMGRKNDR
jgi:hypothetical protein